MFHIYLVLRYANCLIVPDAKLYPPSIRPMCHIGRHKLPSPLPTPQNLDLELAARQVDQGLRIRLPGSLRRPQASQHSGILMSS